RARLREDYRDLFSRWRAQAAARDPRDRRTAQDVADARVRPGSELGPRGRRPCPRYFSSSSKPSSGRLVAKLSVSGIGSPPASLSSSRLNERPVNFVGIGPRGRSVSFLTFFAPGPREGFASGPKLRLRGGCGADVGSKRGPPKPPPGRGPPNPPGRGPPKPPPGRGGPPGPRSSRARASLTASGRPLNATPLNF